MDKIEQQTAHPDYIFEVSWEVCNKVGGIHTVITSKALTLVNEWEDRVIMIGPDTWKGPGENPEFTEDKNLFASLRPYCTARGLKVKIGRWNITGDPIVILVDFTNLINRKDEIFKDLWMRYKVDSLTGGWDYIEPALFGYAAGKVIECFYHNHLTFSDKLIAQFHEWISGVGVLYLNEHVPQIGTVFTTHATVIGRSIAGNGLPLYSKFDSYNVDQEARVFNVIAKHSLEKMAALNADCFTTVSEITAKECEKFLEKKPDIITPNGFDDFIVPDAFFFREKRTIARKKLFEVAKVLFGYEINEDTMLVIKSGRYEFRNKGIDIFIDSMGELNNNNELKRDIIAFIFVPAHSTGARKDLMEALDGGVSGNTSNDKVLTHYLQGVETDPIMNAIKQNKLDNRKENKVKVVFVPVYLNGTDGIFDMPYYDLLVGFDLSVFPSYYEPWGYTPLESLAFHIPTITTNLTGFGMIIHKHINGISDGIVVIDRNDNNEKEAVTNIAKAIKEYSEKNEDEVKIAREAAFDLSKTALWKNFITYYKEAYAMALAKADKRAHLFVHAAKPREIENSQDIDIPKSTDPLWRKIFVQTQFPENLKPLEKLARNLWWTWNRDAVELFAGIDKEIWKQVENNPIELLDNLNYTQLRKLEKNKDFILKLNQVNEKFEEYMQQPVTPNPLIAYFCMEYGLYKNLKIYSGGLGILAGDYLKEASDTGINITGIGLLYRNGYFKQEISIHGEQVVKEESQQFTSLPLIPVYDKDGNWMKINIAFPGRTLYAKVWLVAIGKISLYLLDTEFHENQSEDQSITANLYGGDWENRLKQELILGIGGVRLLRALGISPDIYHKNEGHGAFASLERLLLLMQDDNLSMDEALEVVRASSLFTTHTPIPAGHDIFTEEILRPYLSYYATLLNISWKRLMAMGKSDETDADEKFSMSYLAAKYSGEMNGVSAIHERVSRNIFCQLWKGYAKDELQIGHITNGVHYPTWAAPEWQELYEKTFGKEFLQNSSDANQWKKIMNVPDKIIWDIHTSLKKRLLNEISNRVLKQTGEKYKEIRQFVQKSNLFNEKLLIIGFARRFVAYKRASLVFYDQERLSKIMKNSKYPILFLFAGKAHPEDYEGQEMLRNIVQLSKQESFKESIFFLQNYDIDIAHYFTQGVDLWLNTPELGLEASGTSGMKATLNGVLNFSALDGWWAEAYNDAMGWTFSKLDAEKRNELTDEVDAETLYDKLENEIIPLFGKRDNDDVPMGWVAKMKNSIAQIAPQFTTRRMILEYNQKYYSPIFSNATTIVENKYENAKKLAAWKKKIMQFWKNLDIISMDVFDSANKPFPVGSELNPTIVIDIDELSTDDIGVEIIFIERRDDEENFEKIIFKNELLPIETKGHLITYSCKIPITQSGVYEYGFRIYPKNSLLIHRQDFPLLKWI